MSVLKSKEFTIDGLSGSYVLAMDDLFRVVGVYKDGNILNPAFDEWTDAVLSDESKVIRATYKGVAGEAMSLVEPEVSSEFYNTESKKIENREQAQALIGSSVVQRSPLYAERPSFASPGAVRYSRSAATSTMAYPIDINSKQDHIKITKFKYQRGESGSSVNQSQPGGSVAGSQYAGTVLLPMPKVSDTNGAEWGESDLNVFGLAAAKAFSSTMDLASGGGLPDLSPANLLKFLGSDEFKQIGAGAASLGGAIVASQAVRTIGITVSPDELLARATGKIGNPNAELLFQGPVLRDFGFSFLMIARSQAEGKQIRKIIKWFKEGAAPKYENVALLGSPDVFKLEYSAPILNKFNEMALRTITVDYAPDGYWAAYDDSHPIACVMNLQFTELRPVYDKDHEKTAENSVGF